MNMKIAKVISGLGVLAMTAVLFYGFTVGDFGKDGAALLQNPWGIVSMVDLYTGFILFSVWIIVLDTRAGVRHISPSLIEMARSYGASKPALYLKVILWAALPEILAGIRLGLIRGVKGVVIGQLLVAIVGYGALFETFSRNFRMAQFWALAILLFAFAMIVAELIERAERKVEYYAGVR